MYKAWLQTYRYMDSTVVITLTFIPTTLLGKLNYNYSPKGSERKSHITWYSVCHSLHALLPSIKETDSGTELELLRRLDQQIGQPMTISILLLSPLSPSSFYTGLAVSEHPR